MLTFVTSHPDCTTININTAVAMKSLSQHCLSSDLFGSLLLGLGHHVGKTAVYHCKFLLLFREGTMDVVLLDRLGIAGCLSTALQNEWGIPVMFFFQRR